MVNVFEQADLHPTKSYQPEGILTIMYYTEQILLHKVLNRRDRIKSRLELKRSYQKHELTSVGTFCKRQQ